MWFNYEQINIDGSPDTIADLRRAMEFGVSRKLSSKASWIDIGAESSRVSSTRSLRGRSRSSVGRLTDPGISTGSTPISPSGQKRKGDEDFIDGSGGKKRFKSSDSGTDVANVQVKERDPDTANIYSVEEAKTDSLTGIEYETYGNRIHYCLVVSPAGRSLHAYRSVKELLEALRDAILGHKSLLEDGKILHRDISENNIIITESATEGGPKGRLIDLDLAMGKNTNNRSSNDLWRSERIRNMFPGSFRRWAKSELRFALYCCILFAINQSRSLSGQRCATSVPV
jgi:hypothetical protein